MRNSNCLFSVKRNSLNSEASVLQYFGPRSWLRPTLPNVPMAGRPKALPDEPIGAALKNMFWSPPVFGSPTRSGRQGPTSRSTPQSRYDGVNGRPLWIVVFELNCQP